MIYVVKLVALLALVTFSQLANTCPTEVLSTVKETSPTAGQDRYAGI